LKTRYWFLGYLTELCQLRNLLTLEGDVKVLVNSGISTSNSGSRHSWWCVWHSSIRPNIFEFSWRIFEIGSEYVYQ